MEEAAPSKLDKENGVNSEAEQQRIKEEWKSALAPTIVSIAILWMLKMVQQVQKSNIWQVVICC